MSRSSVRSPLANPHEDSRLPGGEAAARAKQARPESILPYRISWNPYLYCLSKQRHKIQGGGLSLNNYPGTLALVAALIEARMEGRYPDVEWPHK